MTAGTQPQIMAFAAKAQKELKVKLKDAQIEDEDRKAKEAAAAAKSAIGAIGATIAHAAQAAPADF